MAKRGYDYTLKTSEDFIFLLNLTVYRRRGLFDICFDRIRGLGVTRSHQERGLFELGVYQDGA